MFTAIGDIAVAGALHTNVTPMYGAYNRAPRAEEQNKKNKGTELNVYIMRLTFMVRYR